MDQTFMKERKIIPLVLSMSLPMVLSMLVNSLYNIVDSYFVAKVSEDAMTALSLVYPVQIVVTAISVGFGVGINAMIAYFLGAGDEKSANNATTLGTLLSAVHGLLLTIVCIAFIPKFLGMFTGSENVIALGLEYAYIAPALSDHHDSGCSTALPPVPLRRSMDCISGHGSNDCGNRLGNLPPTDKAHVCFF